MNSMVQYNWPNAIAVIKIAESEGFDLDPQRTGAGPSVKFKAILNTLSPADAEAIADWTHIRPAVDIWAKLKIILNKKKDGSENI